MATTRATTTAFIGLGRMGSEMARNLFARQYAKQQQWHAFVVCDANESVSNDFARGFVTQFPNAKISVAATPYEAALLSDSIITMLPSSPQVRTVYQDANGIIPALRKRQELTQSSAASLCIDSTTLDVSVAREVASAVVASGAQMVDAPVSGGVTGAKAATLSFLVGGSPGSYDQAQTLLQLMGRNIFHCGPSGAGLAAKIVNNLILGIHQIAVAEGMLLGEKLGLEPSILADVVGSSTGSCWSMTTNNPVPHAVKGKSPPCERDFEGGFAMSLMLKDMGLATNIGQNMHSPLPLGEAAQGIYEEAISHDKQLGRKDFSSVYRYLKEHNNTGMQ